MAFIALTTAETDFKSPTDEDLWTKVKDNFDSLKTDVGALVGDSNTLNNTVVASGVDGSGRPNYVSAGAGLSVDIDGSVTSVLFVIDGTVFTHSVNTNLASLTASKDLFIFAEDVAGVLTFGFVVDLPPVYDFVAPGGPATDQHWFDLSTMTMKRFDGATFVAKKRIFIAYVRTGAAAVDLVVTFANLITPIMRHTVFGDGSAGAKIITAGTTTEDGLRKFTFFRLASGAVYESTDPQRDTLQIHSQNPIIVEGTIDLKEHAPGSGVDGGRGGAGGGGSSGNTGGGTLRDDGRFTGGGTPASEPGDGGDGADTPYDTWEHILDLNLNGAGGGVGDGGGSVGEGGGGIVLVAPEIVVVSGGVVDCRGGEGSEAAAGGLAGAGGGGGGVAVTLSRVLDISGTINVSGGTATGSPRGGNGGAGKHIKVRV